MVSKVFSGGEKLRAHLEALAAKVGKGATVNVGWAEGATYPDGTPVAMVAAIQEFGAPSVGIPPRPFVRPMIAKESPSWGDKTGAALALHDFDAAQALQMVGDDIAGALAQAIFDVTGPDLSPVTLMLRKMREGRRDEPVTWAMVKEARERVANGESAEGVSTKPLVDSGHMANSITAVVKE